MTVRNTLLLAICLLVATPNPAISQEINPNQYADFDSAQIRCPVAGDFNGDTFQDLAAVVGGSIRVAFSVPYFPTELGVKAASGDFHSILALPSDSGPSTLVCTSSSGLLQIPFDPVGNGFPGLEVLRAEWSSTDLLSTTSFNGSPSIAGRVDSHRIESIHQEDYTINGSWVFPDEVLDFEFLDYDGDGATDIATLTDGWLYVQDWSGTELYSTRTSGFPGSYLAVVKEANQHDRLAWVDRLPSGVYVLFCFRDKDFDMPLILRAPEFNGTAIQDLFPGGMQAGDMDGDGAGDLMVLDRYSRRFVVFWNQRMHAAHFQSLVLGKDHGLFHLDADPTDPANDDVHPLVHDLDDDGLEDIVVPVPEEDELQQFLSVHSPVAITPYWTPGVSPDLSFGPILFNDVGGHGNTIEVPCSWPDDPQNFNHLQGFVYLHQFDVSGNPLPLDAETSVDPILVPLDPVMNLSLPVESSTFFWNHRHFYLLWRLVRIEGGELVDWSPAFTAGYSLPEHEYDADTPPGFTYLDSHPYSYTTAIHLFEPNPNAAAAGKLGSFYSDASPPPFTVIPPMSSDDD